ncbi:hypothetical protein AB0M44_49890, partial [Streptosporangium subroseum]
ITMSRAPSRSTWPNTHRRHTASEPRNAGALGVKERKFGAVDWTSLRHAGGSALDIPGLLQRITEDEDATEAIFQLGLRICHQGVAISEATSRVVPFLIKIAQSDGSPTRTKLLELVQKISGASNAWCAAARNAPPQYRGNYSEKIAWEEAVDQSFVESLPGLAKLAASRDHEIARMAGALLRAYGAGEEPPDGGRAKNG